MTRRQPPAGSGPKYPGRNERGPDAVRAPDNASAFESHRLPAIRPGRRRSGGVLGIQFCVGASASASGGRGRRRSAMNWSNSALSLA
jgi:hypothetical protein